MKKKFRTIWGSKGSFILFTLMICLLMTGCYKQNMVETVIEEKNITGYLEQFPEHYSLMTDILYKTETAGFLGAYGEYTLFAPENEGVKAWISSQGKSSIDDFSKEELLDFVRYHLVQDTVGTARFSDGRIRTPTMFGEYLYTDVVGGQHRINKEVLVTQSNIFCRNGVIHAVERPLVPPTWSLAELIEETPGYTIFTEALKATGFYDTLYFERGMQVDNNKRFQTVIVESDATMNAAGIMSFEDLKDKYSHTGDPKNPTDSLWLYMAYHISKGPVYIADIITQSTLYTVAPQQIISVKYVNRNILLNEAEFNGVFEPGSLLIREKSDVVASNGVLHEIAAPVYIKVRKQEPVYWDVATSPELKQALGAGYENTTPTVLVPVRNQPVIASSIRFSDINASTITNNKYTYSSSGGMGQRARVNGDILELTMRNAGGSRVKWVEFDTPFLVAGSYRVWVCYASYNSSGPQLQAIFNAGAEDEQVMPNLADMRQTLGGSGVNLNDPNADNLMLAQGFKRYMATTGDRHADGATTGWALKSRSEATNVGRLVGTIVVNRTDRHRIRLEAVGGGDGNNNVLLDMIQFIPVDHPDQIYPRFHAAPGELFYAPQ